MCRRDVWRSGINHSGRGTEMLWSRRFGQRQMRYEVTRGYVLVKLKGYYQGCCSPPKPSRTDATKSQRKSDNATRTATEFTSPHLRFTTTVPCNKCLKPREQSSLRFKDWIRLL